MENLTDKVAILTGASRGIGPYIARSLDQKGMRLMLAARNEAGLAEVAGTLGNARFVATDVSIEDDLQRLVDETLAAFGRIDVLINNAGIGTPSLFEARDLASIQHEIDVNLRAPITLTRLVLPHMLAQNEGCLVHIASLAGLGPSGYSEVYGATKHGLVGFSRSLQATLLHKQSNVRSSVICPGFIVGEGMFADQQEASGVRPPRILGASTPQDVADAVVRAVHSGGAEMIVNRQPVRPFLAFGIFFPNLYQRLLRLLGVAEMPVNIIRD